MIRWLHNDISSNDILRAGRDCQWDCCFDKLRIKRILPYFHMWVCVLVCNRHDISPFLLCIMSNSNSTMQVWCRFYTVYLVKFFRSFFGLRLSRFCLSLIEIRWQDPNIITLMLEWGPCLISNWMIVQKGWYWATGWLTAVQSMRLSQVSSL